MINANNKGHLFKYLSAHSFTSWLVVKRERIGATRSAQQCTDTNFLLALKTIMTSQFYDLRILNPSDTHNNFWYYYVFSVYHSPYNHRSTCFEFSIAHHQELFYEQSLKLRVASQYALKNWMFYTIVKYTCYNTS
jgi:hypothetical protein